MRTLTVAFCVDNLGLGGTELNAVRTAERLDRARVRLHVILVGRDGPLRARYERAGVPVHDCPIGGLARPTLPRSALRFHRLMRTLRPDIVHGHDVYANIFACPLARLAGVRGVIASRRWWRHVPRPELLRLNRLAYRSAHRVLANSRSVARLLQDEDGVPARRIRVVPNFADEAAFEPMCEPERTVLRTAWGLRPGQLAVGIAARLEPVKRHDLLLRAFADVAPTAPAARLVILGDGSQQAALERLAGELGIADRVRFAGFVDDVHRAMHALDAAVLCSDSEGFPNAVVEAMAAGLPVVATDVGGVRDAVQSGHSGLVVPPGDVSALAGALRRVLADPALRRALGTTAAADARERFASSVAIGALMDLYGELCT